MNTLIGVCVYMLGVLTTSKLLQSKNETREDISARDMMSIFWPFTLFLFVLTLVWDFIDYIKSKLK
jgi:cytochrome bd-type quinol oxidase subunit 2